MLLSRDYFHRTKHMWTSENTRGVLQKMSPALQAEVLLHVNAVWVRKVSWLKGGFPPFLAEILLALRPAVFAPKETIDSSALHIMHTGIAIFDGRLLRAGSVWGEDMLLASPLLRQRHTARAITYLEVYFIHRDFVLQIALNYVDTWRKLQRKIHFMALRRYIILISQTQRRMKNMTSWLDSCIEDADGLAEGTEKRFRESVEYAKFREFQATFCNDREELADTYDVNRARQLDRALFRLGSITGPVRPTKALVTEEAPQRGRVSRSDMTGADTQVEAKDRVGAAARSSAAPAQQEKNMLDNIKELITGRQQTEALQMGRSCGTLNELSTSLDRGEESLDIGAQLNAMRSEALAALSLHRETLDAISLLRSEVSDLRRKVDAQETTGLRATPGVRISTEEDPMSA